MPGRAWLDGFSAFYCLESGHLGVCSWWVAWLGLFRRTSLTCFGALVGLARGVQRGLLTGVSVLPPHAPSLRVTGFLHSGLGLPVRVRVLVTQLCLTFCDPMDYTRQAPWSPWDSPGKNTRVGCHSLLQGIFLTQRLNPGLLHCRLILYRLSHQGSPSPFKFPPKS